MSGWLTSPFQDQVTEVLTGKSAIPASGYSSKGAYPIFDQGQSEIAGYTDDESKVIKTPLPLVLFGDHTRAVKWINRPFAVGAQGVKLFAARPGVDQRYLYHWLKYIDIPAAGYSRHFKFLKRERIPVPPLNVQLRIVDALDRVDELRRKRREAMALLEGLGQSIFHDMFGDPVLNPHGWRQSSLTEACDCRSGGTPSKSEARYWGGATPWFSAKDLKAHNLFDSADHVTLTAMEETSLRQLPADTAVIVVRGMILAHTFPVSVLRVSATINQDLKAIIPKRPISAQFLAHNLRAQARHALAQVSAAAHGTTRLDNAGLGQIMVIEPPADLQNLFVERVRSATGLIESHRKQLTALNQLYGSLQHRAFNGELQLEP